MWWVRFMSHHLHNILPFIVSFNASQKKKKTSCVSKEYWGYIFYRHPLLCRCEDSGLSASIYKIFSLLSWFSERVTNDLTCEKKILVIYISAISTLKCKLMWDEVGVRAAFLHTIFSSILFFNVSDKEKNWTCVTKKSCTFFLYIFKAIVWYMCWE